MNSQKRQKTLKQTFATDKTQTSYFAKHTTAIPKADDAKGFLDRFRRDVLDALRHQRRSQKGLATPAHSNDDSDWEEEDGMLDEGLGPPESTSVQHVEATGLRYPTILRARLLANSMLSKEQVDGLFETLLLCTTNESLSVVATTTLSVIQLWVDRFPLTTCVPGTDGQGPLICTYHDSYWDPVIAQYTIRTRQHPSQQRNKPNNNNQENSILPGQSGMLARFMQALEQLTIHRNNIAWLCLVRAFACVLHSDLAARLQWVQAVEGRDDVEGTRNTVLRAGFWHRLLAPSHVPRFIPVITSPPTPSREGLLRLLTTIIVAPVNSMVKDATPGSQCSVLLDEEEEGGCGGGGGGYAGCAGGVAGEVLRHLLKLTGTFDTLGLYGHKYTSGSNLRVEIDTCLLDCMFHSSTAFVCQTEQRMSLWQTLEPHDRVRLLTLMLIKRHSIAATDAKQFIILEVTRNNLEAGSLEGFSTKEIQGVLEYCIQCAPLAAKVLKGWSLLVPLACALLGGLVERGDEEGRAVVGRQGPAVLRALQEGMEKLQHHAKGEGALLLWELQMTQRALGMEC